MPPCDSQHNPTLHPNFTLPRPAPQVYLARWDETPVAVKVLLTPDMVEQGELQLPPGVLRDLQEVSRVGGRLVGGGCID